MNIFKRLKQRSLLKKIQKHADMREQGHAAKIEDEIGAVMQLANFYIKNRCDKKLKHADLHIQECYRAAAVLGDREAQYRLGELLLARGRFFQDIFQGPLTHPQQKIYAAPIFDEAFLHLTEATQNGHALALRLHGMAYVNGWGVEKDTAKGFKMVIDSIDMENAWARATKIFESLGLNSPEFFATLSGIRAGK